MIRHFFTPNVILIFILYMQGIEYQPQLFFLRGMSFCKLCKHINTFDLDHPAFMI